MTRRRVGGGRLGIAREPQVLAAQGCFAIEPETANSIARLRDENQSHLGLAQDGPDLVDTNRWNEIWLPHMSLTFDVASPVVWWPASSPPPSFHALSHNTASACAPPRTVLTRDGGGLGQHVVDGVVKRIPLVGIDELRALGA